ncbi:hypothetical protein ID866_8556 [Astraeus odoratus]|nr:hypothetical protein ID866_8556 [Astraeus odoratus]
MGLFACAPVALSLAVDLRVLEFLKGLSVWLTPNIMAWTDTLQVFLNEQGYHHHGSDNFQCCFSNAYHWYCVFFMWNQDLLLNKIVAARVPSMLEEVREHVPLCFEASNWRKEPPTHPMYVSILC